MLKLALSYLMWGVCEGARRMTIVARFFTSWPCVQHAAQLWISRLFHMLGGLSALGVVSVLAVALGTTPAAAIPASERAVLQALYTSTNGAGWINSSNWNGAAGTECTWFGVTCSAGGANVRLLSLRANGLTGSLPALSGLTALRNFDLADNKLTGVIPPIADLTALQVFWVFKNQLTGSIPPLTGLAALQTFDVGDNKLTGGIPALTSLTALQDISVSNNPLTGSIPSLTGLTALRRVFADRSQLTGSIPALTGLTALQILFVSGNSLTGSIPELTTATALVNLQAGGNALTGIIPSLTGLTALAQINVSGNRLTGSIPPLTGLIELRSLLVANNQLTGDVPSLTGLALTASSSSLCANRLTVSVDAAWDAATGSTPWSTACTQTLTFGAAPALTVGGSGTVTTTVRPVSAVSVPVAYSSLTPAVCDVNATSGLVTVLPGATEGSTCTIAANKSGGTTVNDAPQVQQSINVTALVAIPATERAVLVAIYDGTNGAAWRTNTAWKGVVGTECTWAGITCNAEKTHVVGVSLVDNRLTGTLPAITGLTQLQSFDANTNQLTGGIPLLSSMTSLRFFSVGSNKLTGTIPLLAGLSALEELYVDTNQLTGNLPALTGLNALRIFYADDNQLTGSLPSLSGLTALTTFYANNNELSGTLPALSGLTSLSVFNVGNERSFGGDARLQSGAKRRIGGKQLSGKSNQITGEIPSLAGLTSLAYFNVSSNRLTGVIPLLDGLNQLNSFVVDGNLLTGPLPTPPASLSASGSSVCPNPLTISVNAAWDAATGVTPWSNGCVAAVLTAQIINFTPSSPVTITPGQSGTAATLSATGGGSGNPIVFRTTSAPNVCTVIGTTVTYFGAGTCVVTANQAGNATYNAALTVSASIVIQAGVVVVNVTPSVGTANGSISPFNVQVVLIGSQSVFTLTPDAGFIASNVTGTCGGTLVGNTFTTNPITVACTVIAAFAAAPVQGEAVAVPTLSQWALLWLVLIGAGLGALGLRYRQS
jgi:Leucine-rich repeat (LRR) protein